MTNRSIPVLWYANERMSYSCCYMLNQMLADCEHHALGWFDADAKGMIVVFHGQQMLTAPASNAKSLSMLGTGREWMIYISVGDEGCDFAYHLIKHPNMRLWIQTPKPGKVTADRYLIEGIPEHCAELMQNGPAPPRDYDWMFAGQINHSRREQMWEGLVGECGKGMFLPTKGFQQGFDYSTYCNYMKRSKIVLCPAGPLTPDSFRFAEALEAGCVPILDACAPDGVEGYWDMIIPNHPFRVISDWHNVVDVMNDILRNWEKEQEVCGLWWAAHKRWMSMWLAQDLIRLGAV